MAELYYGIKLKTIYGLYKDIPIWYRMSDEECAQTEEKISTITINKREWIVKEKPIRNCRGFWSIEHPEKVPIGSVSQAVPYLLDCCDQMPDSIAIYDPESIELYDVAGHKILGHADKNYALKNAAIEKHVAYKEFPEVKVRIVHWLLPTMRLISKNREQLKILARRIISKWEERGEKCTVAAMAHSVEEGYQIDLILCGEAVSAIRATSSLLFPRPFGMMGKVGFAILDKEMEDDCRAVAEKILAGEKCADDERLSKYAPWQESIEKNYSVGSDNISYIMDLELRSAFAEKLMQMAVFSQTQLDFNKYLEFIDSVAE